MYYLWSTRHYNRLYGIFSLPLSSGKVWGYLTLTDHFLHPFTQVKFIFDKFRFSDLTITYVYAKGICKMNLVF